MDLSTCICNAVVVETTASVPSFPATDTIVLSCYYLTLLHCVFKSLRSNHLRDLLYIWCTGFLKLKFEVSMYVGIYSMIRICGLAIEYFVTNFFNNSIWALTWRCILLKWKISWVCAMKNNQKWCIIYNVVVVVTLSLSRINPQKN